MDKNLEVYRFAVKNLNDFLVSVSDCQLDIVNYFQDKMMNHSSYNTPVKSNYILGVSNIINILEDNKQIIDMINSNIKVLNSNIDRLINIYDYSTNANNLEEVTRKLNEIIKEQSEKIYSVFNDSQSLLENKETVWDDNSSIIKKNCLALYNLATEVNSMLQGIVFKIEENEDNHINKLINKNIVTEQKRIKYISDEAYKIMNIDYVILEQNDQIENLCEILSDEIKISRKKIKELKEILESGLQIKKFEIFLELLIGIIEKKIKMINSSLEQFQDINSRINIKREEQKVNRDNLVKTLDDEAKRIEQYSQKIMNTLEDLQKNKCSSDEIMERLSILYLEEHKQLDEVSERTEKIFFNNSAIIKEKELDTIQYKKYCSILNKSFWEARQKTSLEHIKYPSALYERKVKEYQNDFLIAYYNISLEDIESFIEDYKIKYAEDIYMDDIYDRSLFQLKEESPASIQEFCDESYGLSMLDQRAYKLLQDDLINIIKEIGIVKNEEGIDDVSVTEYRKSFKLSKLLDKKDIIDRQLYIITKRAKRLEKSII